MFYKVRVRYGSVDEEIYVGRIPVEGDMLRFNGYELTVVKVFLLGKQWQPFEDDTVAEVTLMHSR